MVTAIVRKVQAMLRAAGRSDVAVEIVFPVASDAITTPGNSSGASMNGTSAGGPVLFLYNLDLPSFCSKPQILKTKFWRLLSPLLFVFFCGK